ncbi:MAG TPA: hemolysin [Firmicutes bacterium]|nr:hemolysin [Bacillota bacterium]
MDGNPSGSFILIVILIMINAFFASAEMAIVSINKTKLGLLVEDGNKRAKLLQNLLKEPSSFLATIQVGITFAGFFASASAATSISSILGNYLLSFQIPFSQEIAIVVMTILISYLTLIFGELIPKRIALLYAEKVALFVVGPVIWVSKITAPFVWLLSTTTNLILKLIGFKEDGIEEKVSREEIKSLVEIGEEHGVINETEREMIHGIIGFDDTIAKEIMTPRTETFLINIEDGLNELLPLILEENFSRIPVYEDDIDNIIGILYMKDLFAQAVQFGFEQVNIRSILRDPCFIPESNNIDDVFKELQATKNHIAILIDEYGGFSGLVTLEDLIEEVMGEILDEYDEEEPAIQEISLNEYMVCGLLSIDDLNEALNLDLRSDTADTVGGLFLEHLGTVPTEEDDVEIEIDDVVFKILKLDDRRIETLGVKVNNRKM